jgi:hypothetical protein
VQVRARGRDHLRATGVAFFVAMADSRDDVPVANGTKRAVGGIWKVFYDGYWIKAYDAPADSLTAKKRLIEALTRRLFNHVEHGVNIPGARLDEARRAYETEENPQKKRVKAAMLAGALFNRAGDVFTKAVELQAMGVEIRPDNALIRQCGDHLQEALTLGKLVLHRSGEEGIDELWGEPFKAFAFPIEDFYRSRYIKIAQTMRDIDRITGALGAVFGNSPLFAEETGPLIEALGEAAKIKCETLQTDPEIFEVWACFVTACERLSACKPPRSPRHSIEERQQAADGVALLCRGRDLICDITRARVPMPKSTAELIDRLRRYREACGIALPPKRSGGKAGAAAGKRPAAAVRSLHHVDP